MYTIASKMKLFPGFEDEYHRRHSEIWPDLSHLLRTSGISEYHIFLDEETSTLFAVLKTQDPGKLEQLRHHPVMKRWWHYMKDIMETNADESPVSTPLKEVFSL